MKILIILLTLNLPAFCPVAGTLVIFESEPLYLYNVSDPFLRAVMRLESNFRADAVNPVTGARGVLQILPVMINEVNKYSDVKYTWDDAFDPVKSVEIWYKVMAIKNPEYYPDLSCRIWFGTGVQYDGNDWTWYFNIVTKKQYHE